MKSNLFLKRLSVGIKECTKELKDRIARKVSEYEFTIWRLRYEPVHEISNNVAF